jgi:hypothetical protein
VNSGKFYPQCSPWWKKREEFSKFG